MKLDIELGLSLTLPSKPWDYRGKPLCLVDPSYFKRHQ